MPPVRVAFSYLPLTLAKWRENLPCPAVKRQIRCARRRSSERARRMLAPPKRRVVFDATISASRPYMARAYEVGMSAKSDPRVDPAAMRGTHRDRLPRVSPTCGG